MWGIDFFSSAVSVFKGKKGFEGILVSYGVILVKSLGITDVSLYAGCWIGAD